MHVIHLKQKIGSLGSRGQCMNHLLTYFMVRHYMAQKPNFLVKPIVNILYKLPFEMKQVVMENFEGI